jgi:hypothetical protein
MLNPILDSSGGVNDGKIYFESDGPSLWPSFSYPLFNNTFETFATSCRSSSNSSVYHPEWSTKVDAIVSPVGNTFTFNSSRAMPRNVSYDIA